MQQSPFLDKLDVHDNIPVSTTTSSDNDILIERERYEYDDDQEVDDGADGAHALGQVVAVVNLGQVTALQTCLDEGQSEPSDGGIGGSKGQSAEGQGGYQRFAIALQGPN